jgi:hypothetical protein
LLDERTAIAAFFRGEYDDASSSLMAVVDQEGAGASARARLYLASSLAALVVTEGTDDGRMDTARTLMAGTGAAAALQEDRRLISPRLLALLESPR